MREQKLKEPEVAQYQIQDLLPVVMIFVVAGIGVAFGLDIMEDTQDDFGTDACSDRTDGYTTYNATANQCFNGTNFDSVGTGSFNATVDSITGVAKFPAKFPILATVIIAAIIIGVLLTYLAYRGR